jgi:glycosyltransferase involved in cell wall biosynthesis
LYLSSVDWDFRKQDHQFIATKLAERGHHVLFIENTGARFPRMADVSRVIARLRNWSRGRPAAARPLPPGIEIASPLCVPGADGAAERAANLRILLAQLRGALRRTGRIRVMWVGLPTYAALDLADHVRPDVLVYYCGDAFTELPGLRRGIATSERELARRADVVFATSGSLAEHCRALGADPVLVPVAIDVGASAAAREGRTSIPAELAALRGRLIGYMGGLNYKVETAILDAVAERFADDTLVILGSVEDAASAPRARSNVVILGERPYERIHAYLARFAVGLIPYRRNEYTAGVSPAKLLEYLAVGRPVVSTGLPEVLPFADVVRIADGIEPFVQAVAEELDAADSAEQRARRQRRAEANSYERVGSELIATVERKAGARLG